VGRRQLKGRGQGEARRRDREKEERKERERKKEREREEGKRGERKKAPSVRENAACSGTLCFVRLV